MKIAATNPHDFSKQTENTKEFGQSTSGVLDPKPVLIAAYLTVTQPDTNFSLFVPFRQYKEINPVLVLARRNTLLILGQITRSQHGIYLKSMEKKYSQ